MNGGIFLAALLPTILVVVAGLWLIVRLRVKGEGERYEHREYHPDEGRPGNGKRGNGHAPTGRP